MKNKITISEIFWSVPDLKFAEDILFLGLKIKKTKSIGLNFSTYILDDKTRIIAFTEKDHNFKIYDTCLRLSASSETIIYAHKIFQKLNYHCQLAKSEKSSLITLTCFAPSPNSFCEINLSNSK